jgi:NADPH:quinone reductase-like Zn-dependent oxidoreductase
LWVSYVRKSVLDSLSRDHHNRDMSNHTTTAVRPATATTAEFSQKRVMKAWHIRRFGLDALEQVERPMPQPGPRDLLVRIGAASLNYRDRLVVQGTFIPDLALPFVPASDGAGEVVAVGADVTRFRVGDRVTGIYIPKWLHGDGAGPEGTYISRGGPLAGVLAEYVLFDEETVVATPSYLSDREAATLPIAAVTAWVALFDHNHLTPADTVLIEGTGGVSIFALQLAVAAGARVIVTSSSDEKLARAKALGASDGINYRRDPDWHERVLELTDGRGANYILEVVGGENVKRSVQALARNGQIALIGLMDGWTLTADIAPLLFSRGAIRGVLVGSRRNFEDLNRALERVRLRPVIDRVYPFGDVPAAFEHLSRGAFGKIVIEIANVRRDAVVSLD